MVRNEYQNCDVGDDASTIQVVHRRTVWLSTGETLRQILQEATVVSLKIISLNHYGRTENSKRVWTTVELSTAVVLYNMNSGQLRSLLSQSVDSHADFIRRIQERLFQMFRKLSRRSRFLLANTERTRQLQPTFYLNLSLSFNLILAYAALGFAESNRI